MTAARPGIHQLGTVHDDGSTVTISGWGLSLCSAGCTCHRHPLTEQLSIAASDDGALGLTRHRDCDCCQAWSVVELAALLRDVADLHSLPDSATA